MVNRSGSSFYKKFFFNRGVFSLIGLAAIVLISFPFVKNSVKQYRINQEINEFKKEISSLQSKSADLKNFVSYLESDQFTEEQARLNLNLKKPGEELTVIKNGADGSGSASSSAGNQIFDISGYKKEEPSQELSNPEKWLNYFLK